MESLTRVLHNTKMQRGLLAFDKQYGTFEISSGILNRFEGLQRGAGRSQKTCSTRILQLRQSMRMFPRSTAANGLQISVPYSGESPRTTGCLASLHSL